jgi:hypothetical protein
LIAVAHERHGRRGDAGLLELNHHDFSLRPVNMATGPLIRGSPFQLRPRVAARPPRTVAAATEAPDKTRAARGGSSVPLRVLA